MRPATGVKPLGRAGLADSSAREIVQKPRTGAAPSCRSPFGSGSEVSSATSFKIAFSNSASANSFFRRAFSPSSSFNRSASSVFIPQYWDIHRAHVDSAIENCRQTSSTVISPARSFWPSASFRMICSGVYVDETSAILSAHITMTQTIKAPRHLAHFQGPSALRPIPAPHRQGALVTHPILSKKLL